MRPGQPRRVEFEYRRHGTLCAFGALQLETGQTLGLVSERRQYPDFLAFLDALDHWLPSEHSSRIWWILDNLNIHKGKPGKPTQQWLAVHPRFHFVYTPKHASWLTLIEPFWSVFHQLCLRDQSCATKADAQRTIERFFPEYNRLSAHPWAFGKRSTRLL